MFTGLFCKKLRNIRFIGGLLVGMALLIPGKSWAWGSDWQQDINAIMGMQGNLMANGVLRFTLPRTDLRVTVNGIITMPNLVTDGYAAFKQENGQTFLVGELSLLEDEVNPVIEVLERHRTDLDFDFTAHHNHLMKEQPKLMFVHFTAFGQAEGLARVVVEAISKTHEPRTNDESQTDKDDTISGFDVNKVEQILGGTADTVDGVLEITIPCPGQPMTNEGHLFPPEMGGETELHFQSLGHGNVLAAPEICVLKTQVDAVESVLKQSGYFTQTALHNHWAKDDPRVFFIHAYATGNAIKIAEILKQAVEQRSDK